MTQVDDLYFRWLMDFMSDSAGEPFKRMCRMLDQNVFQRRVGNDINRASDGLNLRRRFLEDFSDADIDPRLTNDFLELECSWLEMLVALAERLDYLYDGGIKERFTELITNLGLLKLLAISDRHANTDLFEEVDQQLVDLVTSAVDHNQFDARGHGGLFPLNGFDESDQREVEIWAQHGAYFREKLEGVAWTSTS